jgi:arylsulfatase A-like enzyme
MKRLFIVIFFVLVAAAAVLFMVTRSGTALNVVLVSIDTLRPDHLSCYGYDRTTSPTIDRLAREGVLFENAFSSSPWTLPAHLALLTGLPDLVHGVLTEAERLDDKRVTLAEMMKEKGYKTCGVFTGPFLLPLWGFSQGFDFYLDATLYDKKLEGADMLLASEKGRTTPGAMEKVEFLLDREAKKPFFLFLHLFDVHPDLDPPPPYDTMFDPDYTGSVNGIDIMNNPAVHKDMARRDLDHLLALYDGEIRFVDERGISRLLTILEERHLIDRTLIVITSDHGEEFFEHGVFGHRQNLYDTTLRIPLIIWCPKRIPAGLVVKNQVRIIDIMPTILDLLGLSRSPEAIGESLASLFKPGKAEEKVRPVFSQVKSWKRYLESLRLGQYKVIYDYKSEEKTFIDLARDPAEESPVTDTSRQDFKKALDEFYSVRFNLTGYAKTLAWGNRVAPEIDEELRQRLKSLGYLK